MATWKKSPPELIAAFDAALVAEPRAERRQMFGYPCGFVNGHMAVGLHEDRLIARVPDEAERLPCIIMGRRMKAYAAVDLRSALAAGAMRRWITRAVTFTAAMSPKAAKPRRPATASAKTANAAPGAAKNASVRPSAKKSAKKGAKATAPR